MTKMGTLTVGSTPVLVAEGDSRRTRLHLFATSAAGVYIGLNDGIRAGDPGTFLISQYKEVLVQDYKGPIYAIRPAAADVTMSFFEE